MLSVALVSLLLVLESELTELLSPLLLVELLLLESDDTDTDTELCEMRFKFSFVKGEGTLVIGTLAGTLSWPSEVSAMV